MTHNPISDEDLRSYLLGNLPQPARVLLEERYLSDDPTYERLLAIEEELIDDHVYGLLSPRQWEPLKRSLLLGGDGSERLRFARALEQLRLRGRRSFPGHLGGGLQQWSHRKALVSATIGAVSVLVFVGVWKDFLPENARRESTNHAVGHTDQPRARDASPTDGLPSSTVTLFLRPTSRDKSAANILRIPGGQARVRLEAEFPGNERKSYQITIRRTEGGQTQTSADVRIRAAQSGNILASADFRAESFANGDYILTIFMETGSHSLEEIVAYSFSVVRSPS